MYQIHKITNHPTVDFAAEELKKYLRMMMPRGGEIPIERTPAAKGGFRLGVASDFDLPMDDVEIAELDDLIILDCDAEGGIIAGSNPRAVLLAVYEYLRQNGCRFLFPGVDGELIPMQNIQPVHLRKAAAHRFRGQCNEGSEAQQNMLETIDFTPKIGMNTYMLEFDIPAGYYNRWYNHPYNPNLRPEPVDNDTVLQWKRMCEAEITKRGLLFHDMGHGWNAEPFGIDSSAAWDSVNLPPRTVPAESVQYLAQIDGNRILRKNVPLNTNICLSNPKARSIMADAVVRHAQEEGNVDYLHVWLADGKNNHCECEACSKKRPTDFYIMLLNEIDEKLTALSQNTRIVFIMYVDSYWAPETERLVHPERFTMLFAPITRTYKTSYGVDADMSAVRPYERNHLEYPQGEAANFAYYTKWREQFSGDAFCYEYHFWNKHYEDPGYIRLARLIYDDIRALKKWNLQGIVEDQTQRAFFPTGFPVYLYGRALTDESLSYEDIRDDYFSHAFGAEWKLALRYLEQISDCFDFGYPANAAPVDMTQCRKRVAELVAWFRPIAERNYIQKLRVQTVSWQLLEHHMEFVPLIADTFEEYALGTEEETTRSFQQYLDTIGKKEPQLQRYLDVGLIGKALSRKLRNRPVYEE